ncbi:ankyrin, partial [Rhypophila sp. PSN 637]
IPILELLICYGACVNLPATCIPRTPRQKAAEVGDIDVVQFLIDRRADINARPAIEWGITAVQLAAMSGWAGIVDLLLRKGAHVNAPGARLGGRTALEAAAEQGRLDTVQILINAGAGAGEGVSEQVKRAIRFARENGHIGVYELLRSRFGKDPVPEQDL